MDSLVRGGIALEHNYVQPICSPTRSALMTGYYPIHTGRQVRGMHFHFGKFSAMNDQRIANLRQRGNICMNAVETRYKVTGY